MHRTIDVIVHADGTIEPLEPLAVDGSRRALLTILDEPSAEVASRPKAGLSTAELFAQLRAEGLIEVPEDIPADLMPLSEEEREALAQRIPAGTPLSQIIIEEREERF
jgi:hypothetical protein